MYKSKLLHHPDYDLSWFFQSVGKFNSIANPKGVDEDTQVPIIKSELQEILDSKNETEFMDGIIDGLVTLAPLVDEKDFIYYWANCYEQGYKYTELEEELNTYINTDTGDFHSYEFYADHAAMVHTLLSILVCDECHYETNCDSVLESNLSKFIPINEYHESHYAEVVSKYPSHVVTKEIREYEGEEFVVFFNENGKVLKGHSYYFDPVLICE